MKIIVWLAALLLALYLAACTYMFVQQRAIVFNPSQDDVSLAVDRVPRAINVTLATADGETLKAWWVAPAAGKPVYLYLHGNAGNLVGSFTQPTARAERFAGLTLDGAGLLALSWRGFGGSSGSPSEAGFLLDADTALAWVRQQTPDSSIILFGESLGTGVATQLAAREQFAALILDSPFTSVVNVGAERYPWLPVKLLSKDHFDSISQAANIREPVMIQHCVDDDVVPYAMGQQLYAALASNEKLFRTVEGRCHVPSIFPQLPLLRELETRFTQQ